MAQVLPAERGMRRVIGDGEGVPDGEVPGLEDAYVPSVERVVDAATRLLEF